MSYNVFGDQKKTQKASSDDYSLPVPLQDKCYQLLVNFVFNIHTPVTPTVGNFKFRHGLVQIRTPGN